MGMSKKKQQQMSGVSRFAGPSQSGYGDKPSSGPLAQWHNTKAAKDDEKPRDATSPGDGRVSPFGNGKGDVSDADKADASKPPRDFTGESRRQEPGSAAQRVDVPTAGQQFSKGPEANPQRVSTGSVGDGSKPFKNLR